MMAKTGVGEHDLSAYALVADRITLFYQRYPAGRIVTELHSRTEREITFRALVFRGPAACAARRASHADPADPGAAGAARRRPAPAPRQRRTRPARADRARRGD